MGHSGGMVSTVVSSEAWAKLRDWARVAGRGRLLLSGSFAHASLKTAVFIGIYSYKVSMGRGFQVVLELTADIYRLK